MADDKKPKIDLKARLGKSGGQNPGGAPPSSQGSGSLPAPALSQPAPASSASGLPGPGPSSNSLPEPSFGRSGSIPAPAMHSGPSGGGSAADVLGGLGQVASPFRPQPQARPAQGLSIPVAPLQPQRIEIDETAIHDARKGAFKKALFAGAALSLLFGVVGFAAGGASEKSSARKASVESAGDLTKDVDKSKQTLESLVKKLEEGRDALIKDGNFPDKLAGELGGITVDFNGTKLAGRRFSGFKPETTQNLIGYITSVQEVNDKKERLQRVLGALQKPISEAKAGKRSIVNFAFIQVDPAGNLVASITPLATPIKVEGDKFELPKDGYEYVEGKDKDGKDKKASVPKSVAGPLSKDKPVGAYIPAGDGSGAKTQLILQIADLVVLLKGAEAQAGTVDDSAKPGVIKQADVLLIGLKKVE